MLFFSIFTALIASTVTARRGQKFQTYEYFQVDNFIMGCGAVCTYSFDVRMVPKDGIGKHHHRHHRHRRVNYWAKCVGTLEHIHTYYVCSPLDSRASMKAYVAPVNDEYELRLLYLEQPMLGRHHHYSPSDEWMISLGATEVHMLNEYEDPAVVFNYNVSVNWMTKLGDDIKEVAEERVDTFSSSILEMHFEDQSSP